MRSAHAVNRSPQVRNNSVAPRQRVATRLRTAPQQEVAPRKRRKQARKTSRAPLPNGLSVMGLLVVVLAAIGGMLVVSLNWQRNAHSLAQEEVALRSSLNYVADERQQLVVDERRAINPRFTAARAADAGLNEIKLDERTATAKPATKASKPTGAAKPIGATAKPLPPSPKPLAKPSMIAATTKTASATKPVTATIAMKTVMKTPHPVTQKTERAAIPAMPPSIAKTASVKAALAR